MSSGRYRLITESCLWIAIICAFLVDESAGLYRILINTVFVSAGLISLVTYFYNQHLLKRQEDNRQP